MILFFLISGNEFQQEQDLTLPPKAVGCFPFGTRPTQSKEMCENEMDASHLALRLGERSSLDNKVFLFLFILLILDNNNKLSVCA